jgi:hypothetical protein
MEGELQTNRLSLHNTTSMRMQELFANREVERVANCITENNFSNLVSDLYYGTWLQAIQAKIVFLVGQFEKAKRGIEGAIEVWVGPQRWSTKDSTFREDARKTHSACLQGLLIDCNRGMFVHSSAGKMLTTGATSSSTRRPPVRFANSNDGSAARYGG